MNLKIIGLITTGIGIVANATSSIVDGKRVDETIEKKVQKEVERQLRNLNFEKKGR